MALGAGILLLLLTPPLRAQEGATPTPAAPDAGEAVTLSPSEVVALALAAHPEVARSRERLVELEAQIREARAAALPRVTASAAVDRTRDPGLLNSPQFNDPDFLEPDPGSPFGDFAFDPTPIPVTTYDTAISIEQTIYSFGRVGAGIRAAVVLRERYRAELRDAEIAAARNAARALYDLALADAQVATLAAERASRERQVQQARDFLEIGAGTRLQLLQAQSGLANLRPRELAVEGRQASARAALNETLGRDVLAPVRVRPGLLEESEIPPAPPADALLARVAQRPELRALRVTREALELQARATRAELLPEISFAGNYGFRTIFEEELFNRDFEAWDVGLFVTWPLFDGFETRARAAQVLSQKRQNELVEERRLGELSRDTLAALVEYRRAREARSASERAVEQAEEALRVAEESSRLGAATALDVLNAQQTLTEARFFAFEATRDALVALVELKSLAGLMPSEEFEVTP